MKREFKFKSIDGILRLMEFKVKKGNIDSKKVCYCNFSSEKYF